MSSAEEAPAAEMRAPTPLPLASLADIRAMHQQKYQERQEQAEKEEQERQAETERRKRQLEDESMAQRMAEEEERQCQRQLEADEKFSREVFRQINPGRGVPGVPSGGNAPDVNLADDYSSGDAEYHQLDDDGYRAPMRTGYVDRMIDPDPPAAHAAEFSFLSVEDGPDTSRLLTGDGHDARETRSSSGSWHIMSCVILAIGLIVVLYLLAGPEAIASGLFDRTANGTSSTILPDDSEGGIVVNDSTALVDTTSQTSL